VSGARLLPICLALATAAACSWWQGDKARIRARLDALVDVVNARAEGGLGAVARAAQLGEFFADDVIVELGRGSTPITGRETLMAMATRIEPRTTAFTLELTDVNVHLTPDDRTADVNLTAEILRPSPATGETSMDAREFALVLKVVDGEWKIARLTAVDTLK
jgi:hypothetical protein